MRFSPPGTEDGSRDADLRRSVLLFFSRSSASPGPDAAPSRWLLVDVLDSGGASLHDTRLRRLALQSAGAAVHAIACGGRHVSDEAPEPHVTWAGDESHARSLAERWLRMHAGAATVVASGTRGGGRIARALSQRGPVTWWPTALAPRAAGWLDRGRSGAARASALGGGSDSAAALAGAIYEPPPAGRARAPLWDGDYLLAPLPLTGRGRTLLLRAFATLSASWSGLDLIVLSATDPAGARLARRLGVGGRVHFAGPATARAERAWVGSASAIALESQGPVSAGLVLRALACGVPLLPIEEGPIAAAMREWLTRESAGETPTHRRFGVEALALTLERGDDVQRAIEQGRQLAARHEARVIGASWFAPAAPRRRAA